jgi:hypothetical protein
MFNDKRILAVVPCIVVVSAAFFLFREGISNYYYPPPETQGDGFGGEIIPGGVATPANFEKLRRGMRRHEVWSILGASSGFEGRPHGEWWDVPEFQIGIGYDNNLVTEGAIEFRDGKKIEIRK